MRSVAGSLTDDGAFYEDAHDAEKHEATYALIGAYNQYVGKGGNIERFQNVLINLAPEIRRYLDAVEGPADPTDVVSETDIATIERDILATRKKADKYPSDDGLGGTFEGVVEQPDRGHVSMSDMGDRPRTEEVRNRV